MGDIVYSAKTIAFHIPRMFSLSIHSGSDMLRSVSRGKSIANAWSCNPVS